MNEGMVRDGWQVTGYADIHRLAFSQSSCNGSVNGFMCIFQVVYYSLKLQ